MATGTVKAYRRDRGFGLISADDGSGDVLVDVHDVDEAGHPWLVPGEPVEYERRHDGDGQWKAVAVRPPVGRCHGTVERFHRDRGTGWIKAAEGGPLVWFRAGDVLGDGAEALAEGDVVHYDQTMGEQGLEARRLKRLGPAGEQQGGSTPPGVPELIGIAELGDLLGVGLQWASILVRSPTFPTPLAELKGGPVWTRQSITRFLEQRRRRARHEHRRRLRAARRRRAS